MNQALLSVVIVAFALAASACGSRQDEGQPPVLEAEALEAEVREDSSPDAVSPAALDEPVPPDDAAPELSDLLRLAPVEPVPKGPQSVEWAGEREEETQAETRKKARARIDFSQENVTEGVPMQKERRQTDASVSVPVDESGKLRIKGGVRVNERELSEAEREADTVPTVGVEVQF